jgi:hypothetical protein
MDSQRLGQAMADAAGIAAITAGSTLVASAISGTLSYYTAKRSTGVQLAAIEAEMDRLKAAHDEEERQARKDLYVDFLEIVNRITGVMDGSGELTEAIYEQQAAEHSLATAKMLLFATEPVIAELTPITKAMGRAGTAVTEAESDEGPFDRRAREAFRPHLRTITVGTGRLIGAMKMELRGQKFVDEILAEREQKRKAEEKAMEPEAASPGDDG